MLIPTLLRNEVEEILSLRGSAREERLLKCSNLAAVVAMLPPEELFFTIKEMEAENVPTVLAHARTEQVEFLLDLELWDKDRVRIDRIEAWLRRLVSCGEGSLARWFRQLDLAEATLMLGKVARVSVADDDHDPSQNATGRAPFTLDGMHYISASETLEPLVRALLSTVRKVDESRYVKLVEALLRDVDSELEEYCYQAHQKRLAVRGFPEWEEAMTVYATLGPEAAEKLPTRPEVLPRSDDYEDEVAPRYPVVASEAGPEFLKRALRRLGDAPCLEGIGAELAHLTNQVVVADRLDLDRVGSYEAALRKVAACVSIGLEVLCGDDKSEAARVASRHWMQHLFRMGWTRIRGARTQARGFLRNGWPQGHKERLLLLDSPLPEILEGLLQKHPLWYVGEAEPPPYRPFQTLGEIRKAERTVEKTDFLGRFLMSVIDLRLKDLQEARVWLDTDNLKGTTVFLTALVNAALGEEFRFAPIDRELVREGLARIWRDDHVPRRVRFELRDAAVTWSKTLIAMSQLEESYLQEFTEECFVLLEEEFGYLAPGEVPDPRFLRGLWIE